MVMADRFDDLPKRYDEFIIIRPGTRDQTVFPIWLFTEKRDHSLYAPLPKLLKRNTTGTN